jgi:type IV secretory pathway TraG/TraD family ATPase VirD4
VPFPFSRRKPGIIGSSDPRAGYWGRYRYPNGAFGDEIRIGDTTVKIVVGSNGSGKTAGIVAVNALSRQGLSQIFVDTRMQQAAISAPWRRSVDQKQVVSNAYGCLAQMPDYADLQGMAGINLLEAPELDAAHPLVIDHLTVMAATALPADNDHQPYFPTAAQGLFIGFAYGELVEAKRQGRRPLFANVRRKILERSEYDTATGEPIAGMAYHARQILALGNLFVSSCLDRFTGRSTDEVASVVGTFEANTRWMMSPMLMADELRGGIDFGVFGREVCSGYFGVPAENVAGCAGWLKLVITGAMRPLFAPHKVPVSFWLDEFYALKRLPLVDQIGVVAGSKIEVIIVVQSLAMLKHLYGEAWEAFVGNAGAIILVGSPGDHTTCDYLIKRSAERTIIQPHVGSSINSSGVGLSGGDAYRTQSTLSHGDLYNLKPGTGFVFLHGLADPIPAAFPGYYATALARRARRDPYVRW